MRMHVWHKLLRSGNRGLWWFMRASHEKTSWCNQGQEKVNLINLIADNKKWKLKAKIKMKYESKTSSIDKQLWMGCRPWENILMQSIGNESVHKNFEQINTLHVGQGLLKPFNWSRKTLRKLIHCIQDRDYSNWLFNHRQMVTRASHEKASCCNRGKGKVS